MKYWVKNFLSRGDVAAFKKLEKRFEEIALQMGHVDLHLGNIKTCLETIEERLSKTAKAEEKFLKKRDKQAKREHMETCAMKMKLRAEELTDACKLYFLTVDDPELQERMTNVQIQEDN